MASIHGELVGWSKDLRPGFGRQGKALMRETTTRSGRTDMGIVGTETQA